jgi:hypothetical protein
MKTLLDDLYQRFLSHKGPILDTTIKVLVIFVVASIAWWIFNKILKMIKKRGMERPFFQKNEDIFVLISGSSHK